MALFVLLAALADTPASLTGPLAPAAAGKVACYSPDLAHRTCASTNSFAAAEGRIVNTASVMLGKAPAVTMTSQSTATVAGVRVCTVMRKEDLQAASFIVNGASASDADTSRLRQAVLKAWADMLGRSVCVFWEADGSRFVAHTSVDGLPRPTLDQRMMWVSAADWKVGS
jgi:hypothetical protein